jgi:L-ascorbate metabolism protein UlaG (beta-lactamase superfamily)
MPILRGGAKLTWLGHSTFRIVSPEGKVLYVDPWVRNNPACPAAEKRVRKADILAITHGHFDHIGDAVEIAGQLHPKIVGIFETVSWLDGKGAGNGYPMNKGGTQVLDGIGFTMTHALHSCGIVDEGRIVYGGEAAGYVITLEDGYRIYHAGDTAVFSDMALIGELYAPDLCLLPIGDHFTMGPREAARAIRFLGAKRVVPMHFGTFPLLTGTPEALRKETADVPGLEVLALKPGQTLE